MTASPPPPSPSPSPSGSPKQGTDVSPPPMDREEIYFDGNPSIKGELGTLLGCCGVAIVALVLAWLIGGSTGSTMGMIVAVLIGLVVGVAVVAIPILLTRLTHYKITSYRIDFERGLLSKSIDTLELWHVDDIKFHQSPLDRILFVGTLTVVSDDRTTPALKMKGLPDPRRLFDLLKQRVIAVKRQRGVIKMDLGT